MSDLGIEFLNEQTADADLPSTSPGRCCRHTELYTNRKYLVTIFVVDQVKSGRTRGKAVITIAIRLRQYDDTTTHSTTTEVIEITIRLRYDYDVSRASASIRHDSTRAKK